MQVLLFPHTSVFVNSCNYPSIVSSADKTLVVLIFRFLPAICTVPMQLRSSLTSRKKQNKTTALCAPVLIESSNTQIHILTLFVSYPLSEHIVCYSYMLPVWGIYVSPRIPGCRVCSINNKVVNIFVHNVFSRILGCFAWVASQKVLNRSKGGIQLLQTLLCRRLWTCLPGLW